MRAIRFGVVSESVLDGPAWAEHARRIEDAGIGSLLIRDHFSAGAFGQQLAPFSALAAAAAVTTRLRVGTLVLSNDFRHPAILAHEAASLHHLSGGRFELGLGAGWYQPEYSAAGIPFDGGAGASTGSRSRWPSSGRCWTATPCAIGVTRTRSTA